MPSLDALAVILLAAALGIFQGAVINPPEKRPGWLYVQAGGHSIRRVELGKARLLFDGHVPAKGRARSPSELPPGTEVRVTAQPGADGEWHASKIEVLRLPEAAASHGSDRSRAAQGNR